MTEPIQSTCYWRKRLQEAREQHHAIFKCSTELWTRIEEKHKSILARIIRRNSSVLDCGCGWGRVLDLMPKEWVGAYCGVDISPDFIAIANKREERRLFIVGDLLTLSDSLGNPTSTQYDWAILISIRPMVRRNMGDEVWERMEAQIRQHARKLLYLEYDPDNEGSVE